MPFYLFSLSWVTQRIHSLPQRKFVITRQKTVLIPWNYLQIDQNLPCRTAGQNWSAKRPDFNNWEKKKKGGEEIKNYKLLKTQKIESKSMQGATERTLIRPLLTSALPHCPKYFPAFLVQIPWPLNPAGIIRRKHLCSWIVYQISKFAWCYWVEFTTWNLWFYSQLEIHLHKHYLYNFNNIFEHYIM